MPVVTLGPAPDFGPAARYSEYRSWLLKHFFDHICSYCLIRNKAVQVDHYEPKVYAPARINDPSNLLLGCPHCNGRACKSDYHPLHASRTSRRDDTTGFSVIDVRVDDFALLFEVTTDGHIRPRPGPNKDRASWNIALLKLDFMDDARKSNIKLLRACERAMEGAMDDNNAELRARCEQILLDLIPELAQRALFFKVFDIRVTPRLAARINAELAGQSLTNHVTAASSTLP
jgi:hypothetical protein